MPKAMISFSNEEKNVLCEYASAHPGITQGTLACWCVGRFRLSLKPNQGTISHIFKSQQKYQVLEKVQKGQKRVRGVLSKDLECTLVN